jgi:hypothetical protein
MPSRALAILDDPDAPYLTDAALYYALPAFDALADAAAAAEREWLNARQAEGDAPQDLLDAYKASLVRRRCRLSGTLLERARPADANRGQEADLYIKIRLPAASETFRDRLYECRYTAAHPQDSAHATIADLSRAEVGGEISLFGKLARHFGVPGFFLAEARLYLGEKRAG